MKNSKLKLLATTLGLALAFPVLADRDHHDNDRHDRKKSSKHKYADHYDHKHKYRNRGYRDDSQRHYRSDHYRGERIRLDLPVNLRGKVRVNLKRLIQRNHHINPNHYRLVKVVLNNHTYNRGIARLRAGSFDSQRTYLSAGRNPIKVPSVSGHASWKMHFRHVDIDNIRVVLEPRRGIRDHRKYRKHRKYRDVRYYPTYF